MRNVLFTLAGAGVACLWWRVGVFGQGEESGWIISAVAASIALMVGLIAVAAMEDEL